MTNNKIFWLASYPKSGNTWFRIFLTDLLNTDQEALDLNSIGYGQELSDRKKFDELNGFNSTDLSPSEINKIRSAGLSWISRHAKSSQFFKTHSAYTYNNDASPVLGSTKTGVAGALYFIRNPLDVCISYANHFGISIDAAINVMENKGLKSHDGNRTSFIPEVIGSWSENVRSWESIQDLPVLIIRYEDMLASPLATFQKACDFLKLGKEANCIQKSINECRFENLQTFEKKGAFNEKPAQSESFFRKGVAGDWVNTLSDTQIKRIVSEHKEMMLRFSYLNSTGNPKVS